MPKCCLQQLFKLGFKTDSDTWHVASWTLHVACYILMALAAVCVRVSLLLLLLWRYLYACPAIDPAPDSLAPGAINAWAAFEFRMFSSR